MKEKYLPIGTVVLLKGATHKVMITGFCAVTKDNENKIFDYRGCPFPEGIIDSRGSALFNHDDIYEICHIGYFNDESINMSDKLLLITEKHDK